jgi:glycosyltransferase involved in cell wall biosynthesis
MASGCAIIASRSGGIPEVVSGAGIVVDRDSVDQVVEALRHLVTSSEAMASAKVAAVSRAGEFPWTTAAERLLDVLLDHSSALHSRGAQA